MARTAVCKTLRPTNLPLPLVAAAWALYLLAADGEAGAEVYSAATTRDQARIVWGIARAMADRLTASARARDGR